MKRDFKVTCLECLSDETIKNSDCRFHLGGAVMPTKFYAPSKISFFFKTCERNYIIFLTHVS